MAALLEREQYIERRPLTRGYIMPIITDCECKKTGTGRFSEQIDTFRQCWIVTYGDRRRRKSFQHWRK